MVNTLRILENAYFASWRSIRNLAKLKSKNKINFLALMCLLLQVADLLHG